MYNTKEPHANILPRVSLKGLRHFKTRVPKADVSFSKTEPYTTGRMTEFNGETLTAIVTNCRTGKVVSTVEVMSPIYEAVKRFWVDAKHLPPEQFEVAVKEHFHEENETLRIYALFFTKGLEDEEKFQGDFSYDSSTGKVYWVLYGPENELVISYSESLMAVVVSITKMQDGDPETAAHIRRDLEFYNPINPAGAIYRARSDGKEITDNLPLLIDEMSEYNFTGPILAPAYGSVNYNLVSPGFNGRANYYYVASNHRTGVTRLIPAPDFYEEAKLITMSELRPQVNDLSEQELINITAWVYRVPPTAVAILKSSIYVNHKNLSLRIPYSDGNFDKTHVPHMTFYNSFNGSPVLLSDRCQAITLSHMRKTITFKNEDSHATRVGKLTQAIFQQYPHLFTEDRKPIAADLLRVFPKGGIRSEQEELGVRIEIGVRTGLMNELENIPLFRITK